MEALNQKLSSGELTNHSLRMPRRPQAKADLVPGKGQAYQDLGLTTYKTSSQSSSQGRSKASSSSQFRDSRRKGSNRTVDDDASDDEMDMFSPRNSSPLQSPSSLDRRPRRKTPQQKSSESHAHDPVMVVVDGKAVPAHPEYLPRKQPLPKFNKTKRVDVKLSPNGATNSKSTENDATPRPQAATTHLHPVYSTPVQERLGVLQARGGKLARKPEPASTSRPLQDKSPKPNRPLDVAHRQQPRPKPRLKKLESMPEELPVLLSPQISRVPAPAAESSRMARNIKEFPGNALSPLRVTATSSQDAVPAVRGKEKRNPGRELPAPFPILSPVRDTAASPQDTLAKHRGKRKQSASQDFPVPSPLSSPVRDNSHVVPSRTRKGKHHFTQEFPVPSPLTSPSKDERSEDVAEAFPRLSPLASKSRRSAEDKILEQGAPAPFPMSNGVLKSIGSGQEEINRWPGEHSVKRSSEHVDVEERQRKKNRMNSVDNVAGDTSQLDIDALFLDPSIDPRTLCPYCDEPLPPSPTPFLKSLLAATKKKSYVDPRPCNPLGLKAPLTAFVAVCQRHRFESVQLPKAREKGWPTKIKWKDVRTRVEKMKSSLEKLVNDPGTDVDDVDQGGETDEAKGPRANSIFWQEVMKEVKKKGSRAVVSVQGQFASFEKTQPGYYGELGSVIIHQTLYNLFPPSSFNPAHIVPLTPTEFIQRILVPEAALALIMEDINSTDTEEALKTLRESVQYGVAMFPDTGSTDSGMAGAKARKGLGVGEDIVRERARLRRKELEEEELMERDSGSKGDSGEGEADVSDTGRENPPKDKNRRKSRLRQRDSDTSGTSEAGESPVSGKRRKQRKMLKRSLVSDAIVDYTGGGSQSSSNGRQESSQHGAKWVVRPRPIASKPDAVPCDLDSDDPDDLEAGPSMREPVRVNRRRRDCVDISDGSDNVSGATPRPRKEGSDDVTPRAVRTTTRGKTQALYPLIAASARSTAGELKDTRGASRLRSRDASKVDSSDSESILSPSKLGVEITQKSPKRYSWLLSDTSRSPSFT